MAKQPVIRDKTSSVRILLTPEEKEKLVTYADKHYQTMSGVIHQALSLLYGREESEQMS